MMMKITGISRRFGKSIWECMLPRTTTHICKLVCLYFRYVIDVIIVWLKSQCFPQESSVNLRIIMLHVIYNSHCQKSSNSHPSVDILMFPLKPPPRLHLPSIHKNTLPRDGEIPLGHHGPILHQLGILRLPLLIMHGSFQTSLFPLLRAVKPKRNESQQERRADTTADTDLRTRGEAGPLLGDFLRGAFAVEVFVGFGFPSVCVR